MTVALIVLVFIVLCALMYTKNERNVCPSHHGPANCYYCRHSLGRHRRG